MPPKTNLSLRKLPVLRPAISTSSLLNAPEDAVEGYQDRIENGIDWVLLEDAARHHRKQCQSDDIPTVTFSEGLQNKIKQSILRGFYDETSKLSLQDQWEILIPLTIWDNEKFANEEGKICFNDAHNITDGLMKLIRKAVLLNDKEVLKNELKLVPIMRLNNSKITDLDEHLKEFRNLMTLSLCGNYISEIKTEFLPPTLKSLEFQANRIKDLEGFIEHLPSGLMYLGLARNILADENIIVLSRSPHSLTILDLSDNDIYNLQPVLEALGVLPSLVSLILAGNPCAMCAAYARTTIAWLPRLRWLDNRKILPNDRPLDPYDPHPDDLRSTYFNFTVIRILSVLQPPKLEKGTSYTYHVEVELPLLDSVRRTFLLYRSNESLEELLPLPEDDEELGSKSVRHQVSDGFVVKSETSATRSSIEVSSHPSEIYHRLEPKNSRIIKHYTVFESNRVQWNKTMNFQEPTVKIFCPDLKALRDTFRTTITVRLVYTLTIAPSKSAKNKKNGHKVPDVPLEQRAILATIKCPLQRADWSQRSQHFHWDDSLMRQEALHWGDGDLSILQYGQEKPKTGKSTTESDDTALKQLFPDNLTCHFGFGIDTFRS